MRILLVAVGRIRNGPERELYRHYAARLAWPVTLKEIDPPRQQTVSRQKFYEGEKLLAALPKDVGPRDVAVVALDEGGEVVDSALSAHSSRWPQPSRTQSTIGRGRRGSVMAFI